MKARVITSLALPAALATAGLLNTAEVAYAAAFGSDAPAPSAKYGDQGQPIGNVTLAQGAMDPCTPMGNVTITDYGYCCTPVGNVTITDYGYCCTPVGNVTITDYGQYSTPVGNLTVCHYGHHHPGYPHDNYGPGYQQQHS